MGRGKAAAILAHHENRIAFQGKVLDGAPEDEVLLFHRRRFGLYL